MFDRLEQGYMIVSKYEAHFHKLSRYTMSNIPFEFEQIRRFMKDSPVISKRPQLLLYCLVVHFRAS